MDLNEKMAAEIAAQLGLGGSNSKVSHDTVKKLEGKSDAQLAAEILKLKEQLAANNISPVQQQMLLRRLMPMMDDNQKARLQKVIELLK
ncbi:MAG: hypothetical protein IJB73_05290 [Firmicutes bacterium]|nr:hypothetical protein [Bacillota bacterium]